MEKLFLLQESNAFNLSVGGKEFEESSLIVVLYSQSIQCCTKKKVKKKKQCFSVNFAKYKKFCYFV
jgi:glycine betaine/choline ABC-type transport system substrate-binding protein